MIGGHPAEKESSRAVYELIEERPQDQWEVEALYDLCFAPGRDLLSSYRLRDGVDPVGRLCLAARDDLAILAGAIRAWPVKIGSAAAVLIGPVAVHPTRQGEGLGALLIQEVMARGMASGWERMLLVGDAPYYSRFGFARLDGVEMPPPTNPDRVLGVGNWEGVTGPVEKWDHGQQKFPDSSPRELEPKSAP